MAAVEPRDHDIADDDGSAGSAQGQDGYGTVVDPAPFPVRGVEPEKPSVDGAYGDDPFADRRRRQYFARHLRAPRDGAVRAGECDHGAAAAADHHETGSCAGTSGDGDTGIDLPEPLAGERVVRCDVAFVTGDEHLASGHDRAKIETLAAHAGGGSAAPECLDPGRRLELLELRGLRRVVVASHKPADGAAARQGEHCKEREGARDPRAAGRILDVVRIAHRLAVRVSLMEGM